MKQRQLQQGLQCASLVLVHRSTARVEWLIHSVVLESKKHDLQAKVLAELLHTALEAGACSP